MIVMEFIDYASMPPPGPSNDVIEGFLTEGESAAIFAVPTGGKSMLALHLACCAMTGQPFLGFKVIKPGDVLWINCEVLQKGWQRRADRVVKGLPGGLQRKLYYCRPPGLGILTESAIKQTASFIAEHNKANDADHQIALVIIDSFQTAAGCDPKDPQLTSRFYQSLRMLNTAAIVLDHTAKARPGAGPSTSFGSQMKLATADREYRLENTGLEHGPERRVVLESTKVRDGDSVGRTGCIITFEVDPTTGHELKDGAITFATMGESEAVKVAIARPPNLLSRILRALGGRGDPPMTADQIASTVSNDGNGPVEVTSVKSQLSAPHKAGLIENTDASGESLHGWRRCA
jgi:hypothetical protein